MFLKYARQTTQLCRIFHSLFDFLRAALLFDQTVCDLSIDGFLKDLVIRVLEHITYLTRNLCRGKSLGRLSIHQNFTLGRSKQPVHQFNRCRLTCTILADDGHGLTQLKRHTDVFYCLKSIRVSKPDIF